MMKALIYARQSSGKDDFSESVEAQIANCKKLAAQEKLEVIGVYKDLNTSGETYPVGAEEIARLDSAYVKWSCSQSTKKDFRIGLCHALQKLSEVDFVLVNELTRLYYHLFVLITAWRSEITSLPLKNTCRWRRS